MNLKKTIAIVAVMALAMGAFAQGGGQGRGGFRMMGGQMGRMSSTQLLQRDDVKDELKLTDDQKSKLADLNTKARDKMREVFQNSGFQPGTPPSEDQQKKMAEAMTKVGEDINKEVNTILTADQQKRLKELLVQRSGNGIANNPDFQKDLGITDDQKAKIADLNKKMADANRQIFQKMQDGEIDRSQIRELMDKNTKALNDEIGKLLTDDQKKKIADMGGKPFTFKENTGN